MRLVDLLLACAALVGPAAAAAAAPPRDPLGSPMWDFHARRLFGSDPVVFDEAVAVTIPPIAENQRVFPVTVDARKLAGVKRIVLFGDLNPIPVAIDFRPTGAAPFIATRIKLDQRTPVRAAVQTLDGTWHVAGSWIDAAGGGCSAPPVSRVKGDWADHLGEVRGGAWRDGIDTRLRVTIRHPMDTGLVENIAAYNVDRLTVSDEAGQRLAEMTVYGSVAEDPAFTFIVPGTGSGAFAIAAHDSNGLAFSGTARSAPGPAPALRK